jgi:myo-inositol-1-phosphate synthase
MADRRVGLWLIGALGGVGSTVALGLAALRRHLTDYAGLVTARPLFAGLDLDQAEQFTLGGHDIRQGDFSAAVHALARGSAVFDSRLIDACAEDLDRWSRNVRPGIVTHCGPAIISLADRTDLPQPSSPRDAIQVIQTELREFQSIHALDQVVVVNVASTEPPFTAAPEHDSLDQLRDRLEIADLLPASSIYAYAALDLGWPYINFTPSTGAALPALIDLAQQRGAPVAGQDGKTGETLVKSVLAPMFVERNLRILSWVGHNILGNRDGQILHDPAHKSAKARAKDRIVGEIVGYDPQTLTSIEFVASLDDWKTAWDHIHFQGFLGVKMAMQFTWQGCDSVLAAPLVIDLARLALFAQRRQQAGVLRHLACFFKSPLGVGERDFSHQTAMLAEYIHSNANCQPPSRENKSNRTHEARI